MNEPFYHLLGADGGGKVQVLFSDLDLTELNKSFVKPFRRGESFFAGSRLIRPLELQTILIIETSERESTVRQRINRDDLARIEELNRDSNIVFLSPGIGYAPEDLLEGGADVTRQFLSQGPGASATLFGMSKRLLLWILGIVAGVLSTGLAKWVGWA